MPNTVKRVGQDAMQLIADIDDGWPRARAHRAAYAITAVLVPELAGAVFDYIVVFHMTLLAY